MDIDPNLTVAATAMMNKLAALAVVKLAVPQAVFMAVDLTGEEADVVISRDGEIYDGYYFLIKGDVASDDELLFL
ncbi:MAG: hypothetical protein COB24_08790 [Hyphomicrobiales bacterium]|nr:MAG: hypothetical protein COB24_08790 [Hyphomicrobiales bacterium]